MRQHLIYFLGLAFVLAGAASNAIAANITAAPTRIILTPTDAISEVVVRNGGTANTLIATEVAGWEQTNGEDRYEPTHDILINPGTFKIPPGGEQVVRVGLTVPNADKELSYRLYLQEVATPETPKQEDGIALLRIGIPIFIPPKQVTRALVWSLQPAPDGRLGIAVANNGNVHAQIYNLRVLDDNGGIVSQEDVFAYVLPGQHHAFEIKATADMKRKQVLHLLAMTDGTEERIQLQVDPSKSK